MKYIILGFVMIITSSWNMLQSSKTKSDQDSTIQIHGKVHTLKGNIILNIQGNYLALTTSDRFTLLVKTSNQDKLTIQVIDKPQDQECEIIKLSNSNDIIRIDIDCQMIADVTLSDAVIAL